MFKHILMPVDLAAPPSWRQTLPVAEMMVECFSAQLTICTVATTAEALEKGECWPISYREELAEKHAELDGIAALLKNRIKVDVEVGTGGIAGGIVDLAERIDADLIVLSSHQHKLADFLVSTKAARVSRIANCSVLVVRIKDQGF